MGAQVKIAPEQTKEKIENWFKTLKYNNMSYSRIRMFESHMRYKNNNWDFTFSGYALEIGDTPGIRVYTTLLFGCKI